MSPKDLKPRVTGSESMIKATPTSDTDRLFLTGPKTAVFGSLVKMSGMNRPFPCRLLSNLFCRDVGSKKGQIHYHEPIRQLFSCCSLFNFSQESRVIDPAKQVFKAGDFVSINFLK